MQGARYVFDDGRSGWEGQDALLDLHETRIELFADTGPLALLILVYCGKVLKRLLRVDDLHALRRRACIAATASALARRPARRSATPASMPSSSSCVA